MHSLHFQYVMTFNFAMKNLAPDQTAIRPKSALFAISLAMFGRTIGVGTIEDRLLQN